MNTIVDRVLRRMTLQQEIVPKCVDCGEPVATYTNQEDRTVTDIPQALAKLRAEKEALEKRVSNLVLDEVEKFESSTGVYIDSFDIHLITQKVMGKDFNGKDVVLSKFHDTIITDVSLEEL